jgi:O-acetyl-ADP-ribose deacetylase (regulator of RNase III)
MTLLFLTGDATDPQAEGNLIIAHICNSLGGWGKGFVLAISKLWPQPEEEYRRWHRLRADNDFELGAVQFVQVTPCIWVANMIAQEGMKTGKNGSPIRYEALELCLKQVADKAIETESSVHMPRIGCGLAGGRWDLIEPIVLRTLDMKGIAVTVYDLE